MLPVASECTSVRTGTCIHWADCKYRHKWESWEHTDCRVRQWYQQLIVDSSHSQSGESLSRNFFGDNFREGIKQFGLHWDRVSHLNIIDGGGNKGSFPFLVRAPHQEGWNDLQILGLISIIPSSSTWTSTTPRQSTVKVVACDGQQWKIPLNNRWIISHPKSIHPP